MSNSHVFLPIGTRIRFTKVLACAASGDHPALLYANKGDCGAVTGHGTQEGYWVATDHWPAAFGASQDEFELLHPDLFGGATPMRVPRSCHVCGCTDDDCSQCIERPEWC